MEHVLIWEPKPIPKVEFRLYYDDKGKVICYSGEQLDGNYIIIDAATYAEGRPDIRIIDGKISKASTSAIVTKLIANDVEGIECAFEDVSIVIDSSYIGKKQKWKLDIHELG